MKIEIRQTFEIDWDKEIARINDNFKGKQRKRLLAIMDDFKNSKFQECMDKMDALGYCNKGNCAEQEYLPIFLDDLFSYGGRIGLYLSTKNSIIISE